MNAFKMLEELAKRPEFKDAFWLENPYSMFGEKDDKDLAKEMTRFFELEHDTQQKKFVETARFHGWMPYAKRHEKLNGLCKSEIVELQYSENNDLPRWWAREFPQGSDTPESMKKIFKAITGEEFTSGIIEPERWTKLKNTFKSPMDRKVFVKPKISSILDKLKEAGLLPHEFVVKYNERGKHKNGVYRATLSDKPTDFYRCSKTKAFSSCLSPDGQYHYTVWGALTDANLLIFFWEPPTEITEEKWKDTRLRTFLHLMADYGPNFQKFYNALCAEAVNKQNPQILIDGFKKIEAKQWYLVVDKIHTDDHASNTHPVLFTLFDMLKDTDIKLAIPSEYCFSQREVGLKARVDSDKMSSADVHSPINWLYGLGGYQDNLKILMPNVKLPANTEMFHDKYAGEGGGDGGRGFTNIIRSYKKNIYILDKREHISSISIGG